MDKFKAMVVREENEAVTYRLEEVQLDNLSEGEVVIEVDYSSVNYKDMLAVQKRGGVIRNYPMIPGIDLAGTVVSSTVGSFKTGEKVVVNSTDVGVSKTGGFSEYARVEAKNLLHIPEGLSTKEAMLYGTAGFTAALSIKKLEQHGMSPEKDQDILVTGSTGGVGSVAVRILEKAGYKNIHALIRKDYQIEVAKSLGATDIVHTGEFANAKNTLAPRNYHYVVDTVGGDIAAKVLAQLYENGSMAMSGNAGGLQFPATVLPFILRGVNVLGINSVDYPLEGKKAIWEKMANEWYVADRLVSNEVPLAELKQTIDALKEGQHVGRTIVKIK